MARFLRFGWCGIDFGRFCSASTDSICRCHQWLVSGGDGGHDPLSSLTFAKLLAFGAPYSQRREIVTVAPRLSEGIEPE